MERSPTEAQAMTNTIDIETLLLKEGTPLPNSLFIESDPCLNGWRKIRNPDSSALDRKLTGLGWTFFFMAGELTATAFGWDLEKTTRKATEGVIAKMNHGGFNCLEISRITRKSFLGLPYVAVAGHARHIQESLYLFHAKDIREWDQPKLAIVPTVA
jgi:hypothetical protein